MILKRGASTINGISTKHRLQNNDVYEKLTINTHFQETDFSFIWVIFIFLFLDLDFKLTQDKAKSNNYPNIRDLDNNILNAE